MGASREPVPDVVKIRARRAASMRVPADVELLELVYDSVLDAEVLLPPGGAHTRVLAFSGGGARLEVKIDCTKSQTCRLSGWVVPVAATVATVRTECGTRTLGIDDYGGFSLDHLVPAQVSVLVEVPLRGTTRRFQSSWFAI